MANYARVSEPYAGISPHIVPSSFPSKPHVHVIENPIPPASPISISVRPTSRNQKLGKWRLYADTAHGNGALLSCDTFSRPCSNCHTMHLDIIITPLRQPKGTYPMEELALIVLRKC